MGLYLCQKQDNWGPFGNLDPNGILKNAQQVQILKSSEVGAYVHLQLYKHFLNTQELEVELWVNFENEI